jgi:hypothetical protein
LWFISATATSANYGLGALAVAGCTLKDPTNEFPSGIKKRDEHFDARPVRGFL